MCYNIIKDRFSFHCLYCQCNECCRRVEGGGCIVRGRCWCQDITLQLCNFVHNPTWHSADSATFYNYKQTWSSRTIPASSYLWFNKTDGFWTRRWREVHPLYSHYTYTLELETKVIRRFPEISQSWRRPSPGWKGLLALSHLRHYKDNILNGHWPQVK